MMTPPMVRTIQEEILYEYAKLISRSTHGGLERSFITIQFKKLRAGEISISDTIRKWEQEQEPPRRCAFCGRTTDLMTDRLIPKNRGGGESADNLVLSCKQCKEARGDRGIFEWLGLKKKDELHRLVAGKYLKQLLKIHEEAGTLYTAKSDIGELCPMCPLPEVCAKWNTVGVLTCFCLESVLPRK
jgi:hypothetical protein